MKHYELGKRRHLFLKIDMVYSQRKVFNSVCRCSCPDLEVIKLFFSSSAQLSMKFQLRINVEIVKISGKFRFNTQQLVSYPAHKC